MRDEILPVDHIPVIKSITNYVAAALGIGTFLGLVNLLVGLLSASWLAIQIYGYLSHELPMKRLRKKLLIKELADDYHDTKSGGF